MIEEGERERDYAGGNGNTVIASFVSEALPNL